MTDAGRAAIIRRNAAEDRLYTDDEFLAARAEYFVKYGNDPLDDDTFATGWQEWQYCRPRWWWSPPWKLTRPWLPCVHVHRKGSDEWCNPTVFMILPLFLGSLTVRYKRKLRTRADGNCDACIAERGHPNCPLCGFDHWPTCVPVRVICDRCTRKFGEKGDTGRFAREDSPYTISGHLYCSARCADHGRP